MPYRKLSISVLISVLLTASLYSQSQCTFPVILDSTFIKKVRVTNDSIFNEKGLLINKESETKNYSAFVAPSPSIKKLKENFGKMLPKMPLVNDAAISLEVQKSSKRIAMEFVSRMQSNLSTGRMSGHTMSIYSDVNQNLAAINKALKTSPISFNNGYLETMGHINTAYVDSSTNYSVNQIEIYEGVSLFSIPANVSYQFQDYASPGFPSVNNFSANFDKNNYLAGLKNKLKGKFNPQDLLPEKVDVTQLAKQNAEQLLRIEIEALETKYQASLQTQLNKLGGVNSLFGKDISTIREAFLNESFIQAVNDKQMAFEQLQARLNNGEKIDSTTYFGLKSALSEYAMTRELLSKIEEQKEKWQKSGLIDNIKNNEIIKKTKLEELSNAPATIRKLARNKLNLSSVQRFFLNVNKLTIGQGATNLSPMTLKNYLAKGLSTEFLNSRNNYFSVLMGGHSDFSSLYDFPFSGYSQSNTNFTSGFRFGKGELSGSHSHISFISFKQGRQSQFLRQASPSRNSSVFTLSNRVNIGSGGFISGEISKSATEYNYYRNPLDSFQQDKGALNALMASQNFFSNIAFDINYENSYPASGSSHRIYFRYAGLSYYNPGNAFLVTGSRELGGQIRQVILKNRLNAGLRVSLREYQFGDASNDKWRNSSINFDLKWKMKKGQYLSIRYQPVKTTKLNSQLKSTLSLNNRLSAEVALNKKLWRIPYRNNVSVTFQESQYTLDINNPVRNSSVLVSSYQTIMVKNHMIYWNTNYNAINNNSQYVYFNSSFLTDIGLTYSIVPGITASSGITYSSVKAWYEQVGIRQTITGQIGKNLSMNLFLDARRNIKEHQDYYQELFRVEWAIRYCFNNGHQ